MCVCLCFQVWQLRGRYPNRGYPKIFNDETVGSEAKKLFEDAQVLLRDIVKNKSLTVRGIVGLYPANSAGDDIQLFKDEAGRGSAPVATFHTLRQQAEKEDDAPYMALSRFHCASRLGGQGLPGDVCGLGWLRPRRHGQEVQGGQR